MAEETFGERLMEARRIKNETIEEVSDILRIRPSIILAMETSNFSHLPHKGYARNMVSSYARYLGLDSTKLTEQFLKEYRRWESTGTHGHSSGANSIGLPTKRNSDPDEPLLDKDNPVDRRELITAAGRNRYRTDVFGKDTTKETDRAFKSQLRQNQNDRFVQQRNATKRTPTRKSIIDDEQQHSSRKLRPNDYIGKPPKRSLFSGNSTGLSKQPLLWIIILVVGFIALLIIWAVLASNCANNDVAHSPVVGITGEDTGLDAGDATLSPADIEAQIAEDNRYGSFEMLVEVSGGASWLKIEVDGTVEYSDVFESGWRTTIVVSDSTRVESGAPGFVRVFRNGIEVPGEMIDGIGVWEIKVEQRPIAQNAQTADAA